MSSITYYNNLSLNGLSLALQGYAEKHPTISHYCGRIGSVLSAAAPIASHFSKRVAKAVSSSFGLIRCVSSLVQAAKLFWQRKWCRGAFHEALGAFEIMGPLFNSEFALAITSARDCVRNVGQVFHVSGKMAKVQFSLSALHNLTYLVSLYTESKSAPIFLTATAIAETLASLATHAHEGNYVEIPFLLTVVGIKTKQLSLAVVNYEITQKVYNCDSECLSTMRQLLALKRNLSPSHYLFSHGISLRHAQLPELIGALDHRMWPKRDAEGFTFIRVVPHGSPQAHLSDIIPLFRSASMNDHDLRNELLCADANLFNQERYESALDFYMHNSNVHSEFSAIACTILDSYAKPFNMNFSQPRCKFREDIRDFHDALKDIDYGPKVHKGALLAYAVPKPIIHNPKTNFVYTSLPFGKPWNIPNPLAELDELQAGHGREGISVRLLTSHLRPENGIKSFWLGKSATKSPQEQIVTERISVIVENFSSMVVQHCRLLTAQTPVESFTEQSSAGPQAECERLLSEVARGK